ncbi:Imm6 family immunity protein [Thermoactinomyces sp. CICC 23799]|jgi:hypothetical protein|uniref:Imm6 family immunity protein n=1 Tax=Thermoactinomyces sp. CICC 23799 TaxID=2767429 RepID=UPI0018DCF297|nr:Imm6 family immunity protein [Thermoactinomyces sp. CICC 23799]MBH8601505.1 hypothetical protein [Thermoactinomyces sp. CICC 23799]
MHWYNYVNDDAKVAFVLTLTERVIDKLVNYRWYSQIRETMNMCWEWVEGKKYRGDELYDQLEDDEDQGLFVVYIEEIDCEMPVSGDPQVKQVFDCVLYAAACATRQAYVYDGELNHCPQTVNIAHDEFIDEVFMEEIKKVDGYQEEWAERLKQYLMKNHPAGRDKKMKREELLNLIAQK